MNDQEIHHVKALECLAGAESELANGRYNNAANRAYYACFHAAIVALRRAGYERTVWSHEEVPALFAGQLIVRRKLYPADLRAELVAAAELRITADYESNLVSRIRAERSVRRARRFTEAVL